MASIESRVVPARSLTMDRLDPKIVLRRELLPTFGLPTIAILISSCIAMKRKPRQYLYHVKLMPRRNILPLPLLAHHQMQTLPPHIF